MESRRFDLIGSLALIGGLVCWGVVPVFLKALTGYVDPWVANGIRYPLAAAFYWPVLVGALRSGSLTRSLLQRAAVPASLSFCGQILWAMAPYYLSASLVGFLIRTSMLWAIAGAMVLFAEERVLLRSRRFYFGVVLALVGLVFLSDPSGAAHTAADPPVTAAGLAIILTCSLFFGLYGVSVRQFLRGVHPILAFGMVSQPVAAGTFVLMLCFGSLETIPTLSGKAWLFLCVSSFLGIGISHVFYYSAIHRLGASIASSVHLVTPFLTHGAAFVFLGEALRPGQWFAGVTMIGGGGLILLAQEDQARRRALLEAELSATPE